MFTYDEKKSALVGPSGFLPLCAGDKAIVKMAMILQGECSEVGPIQAAKNFHYSKARYYQILHEFQEKGVEGLIDKKQGPKTNYRRTPEVKKLVIRARFLDPDASSEVIAAKLRQDGYKISHRSVARIISDYGLQKKTPRSLPVERAKNHRGTDGERAPTKGSL